MQQEADARRDGQGMETRHGHLNAARHRHHRGFLLHPALDCRMITCGTDGILRIAA